MLYHGNGCVGDLGRKAVGLAPAQTKQLLRLFKEHLDGPTYLIGFDHLSIVALSHFYVSQC
jgi:hypothetical protein